VRDPGDPERAELCLAEELAKLAALDGAEAEIAEAERELTALDADEETPDAPLTWRLRAVAEARTRAARSAEGDRAAFDIADNGVRLDRGERASFEALLASLSFGKGQGDR
jgi:DNA primase